MSLFPRSPQQPPQQQQQQQQQPPRNRLSDPASTVSSLPYPSTPPHANLFSARPASHTWRGTNSSSPDDPVPLESTYADLLEQPNTRLAFTDVSNVPGELLDHLDDWWEARSSEQAFQSPAYHVLRYVIGPKSHGRVNDNVNKPKLQMWANWCIRHFGTIDASNVEHRVENTFVLRAFREARAQERRRESHSATDHTLDDKAGLLCPDGILAVTTTNPVMREAARRRIKRRSEKEAKKDKTTADPSPPIVAPAETTEQHGGVLGSIATPRSGSHLTTTNNTDASATSDTSHLATEDRMAKRQRDEQVVENYTAIAGLSLEMKYRKYFQMLCQGTGYLMALHEACGTILGLLINSVRFARMVVLPSDNGDSRTRIALECGKVEWWGTTKTMEDLDEHCYSSHTLLPFEVVSGMADDNYKVELHGLVRLCRFVELGRDIIKTMPLSTPWTWEDAHKRSKDLTADAQDELDCARRPFDDNVGPADNTLYSNLPNTARHTILDLGPCQHLSGVTSVPPPTQATNPSSTEEANRAVHLIGRGARRWQTVPPPRNTLARRSTTSSVQASQPGKDDQDGPAGGGGAGPTGGGGSGGGRAGGGGGDGGVNRPSGGGSGDQGGSDGSSMGGSGHTLQLQLTKANLATLDRLHGTRPVSSASRFSPSSSSSSATDPSYPSYHSGPSSAAAAAAAAVDLKPYNAALAKVTYEFVSPKEMDRIVARLEASVALTSVPCSLAAVSALHAATHTTGKQGSHVPTVSLSSTQTGPVVFGHDHVRQMVVRDGMELRASTLAAKGPPEPSDLQQEDPRTIH